MRSPRGSKSPDLRGQTVRMAAADHPYAGKRGKVVEQVPCDVCATGSLPDCGYDDLIVELQDGTRTRVYEPETD